MAKPALQDIYKGSFKNRPRFDDGGYVDYSGGNLSPIDTTYADQYRQPDPDLSAISTTQAQNTAANNRLEAQHNINAIDAAPTASSSSSSGALSKILAGMGLGGGNTSNAAALGAAVKLLSAYGQYKQNSSAGKLPNMPALPGMPSLPGSASTPGYGPPGGYNYSNYGSGAAGTGYAPRTQAPAAPPASYFTYGQGPESQFFQQVRPGSIAPVTGGMKAGGSVKGFDVGGIVPMSGAPGAQPTGGLMAGPGMTPMTPRPMTQPQLPQMGAQPPRPPMPQMGMQPRPQTPPPQMPSTMMQRMARPGQMGQRAQFADGGSCGPTDSNGVTPAESTAPTGGPPPAPTQSGNTPMPQPLAPMPQQSSSPVPVGQGLGFLGTHMAAGGGAQQGALSAVGQSRHIQGPGDGTSDSIPARLANGEYVIDAQAVSMLGNGDNSAGAKRLDEFRKNLRQHKGGALSKGQMAPDAKPIHKYMGGQ